MFASHKSQNHTSQSAIQDFHAQIIALYPPMIWRNTDPGVFVWPKLLKHGLQIEEPSAQCHYTISRRVFKLKGNCNEQRGDSWQSLRAAEVERHNYNVCEVFLTWLSQLTTGPDCSDCCFKRHASKLLYLCFLQAPLTEQQQFQVYREPSQEGHWESIEGDPEIGSNCRTTHK